MVLYLTATGQYNDPYPKPLIMIEPRDNQDEEEDEEGAKKRNR
jgi:hypothetical protein